MTSGQNIQQTGLSCTTSAHDGHDLSWPDQTANIPKNLLATNDVAHILEHEGRGNMFRHQLGSLVIGESNVTVSRGSRVLGQIPYGEGQTEQEYENTDDGENDRQSVVGARRTDESRNL